MEHFLPLWVCFKHSRSKTAVNFLTIQRNRHPLLGQTSRAGQSAPSSCPVPCTVGVFLHPYSGSSVPLVGVLPRCTQTSGIDRHTPKTRPQTIQSADALYLYHGDRSTARLQIQPFPCVHNGYSMITLASLYTTIWSMCL